MFSTAYFIANKGNAWHNDIGKKDMEARRMTGDMKYEQMLEESFANVDITNDLMFSTVMQDEALCMELLEYLLPLQPGRRIERLKYRQFTDSLSEDGEPIISGTDQTQKTYLGYFGQRGVRLDVFVDDGETVYDLEMQTTGNTALPQRSRLIQSHMDISQLQRGAQYDELRPSFVIFICKFDPFGDDLYRYTFYNTCKELDGKPLNDGSYKLFFNTNGHIGDFPQRLKELLNYMNDTQTYRVNESKDDLIRKLDAAVNETKMQPVWRDAFMMYQMKQREAELRGKVKGLEEGRAEGEAKGRSAEKKSSTKRMILKGYTDDEISEINELPLSEVAAIRASMTN